MRTSAGSKHAMWVDQAAVTRTSSAEDTQTSAVVGRVTMQHTRRHRPQRLCVLSACGPHRPTPSRILSGIRLDILKLYVIDSGGGSTSINCSSRGCRHEGVTACRQALHTGRGTPQWTPCSPSAHQEATEELKASSARPRSSDPPQQPSLATPVPVAPSSLPAQL